MRLRPPTTADAVTAFLESRRAQGCSPKTLQRYRYTLGRLQNAHRRLPARPEAVETLLANLRVGAHTRHAFWRDLRAFYRWSHGRLGVRNAAASVRAPRRRPSPPRTLTDLQVDQLLQLELTRRDRAIVQLLLDTGIRLGELAGLRWSDVSGDVVAVDGKTGRRLVPISTSTRGLLVAQGDVRHLWVGPNGPLTTSGVSQVVKRALRRVGVAGGPHLLRHTFGRMYVTAGGDVFSLQRILGHAQISTTRVYVGLDLRDVQAQHAKFSPVARRAAQAAAG